VRDGKPSSKRLEMKVWEIENGLVGDGRKSGERWEEK
jgi:hypothetical protein